MDNNIFGRSLEDDGYFVGCAHDGDDPFRISDPIEDFALGVWIAAINFVENDTGFAGIPSVLDK
jgi:hypothetical protein